MLGWWHWFAPHMCSTAAVAERAEGGCATEKCPAVVVIQPWHQPQKHTWNCYGMLIWKVCSPDGEKKYCFVKNLSSFIIYIIIFIFIFYIYNECISSDDTTLGPLKRICLGALACTGLHVYWWWGNTSVQIYFNKLDIQHKSWVFLSVQMLSTSLPGRGAEWARPAWMPQTSGEFSLLEASVSFTSLCEYVTRNMPI